MADDRNDPTGDGWLDSYLPYQIYRVSALMNARLQGRLASSGISLSQWRVLSVIRSFGPQSITAIIEQTLMEQPTVSRVISAMERDGLLIKSPSPDDLRIMHVALTAKGDAIFDEISPSATRRQKDALSRLTAKQILALKASLKKIEDAIHDS